MANRYCKSCKAVTAHTYVKCTYGYETILEAYVCFVCGGTNNVPVWARGLW